MQQQLEIPSTPSRRKSPMKSGGGRPKLKLKLPLYDESPSSSPLSVGKPSMIAKPPLAFDDLDQTSHAQVKGYDKEENSGSTNNNNHKIIRSVVALIMIFVTLDAALRSDFMSQSFGKTADAMPQQQQIVNATLITYNTTETTTMSSNNTTSTNRIAKHTPAPHFINIPRLQPHQLKLPTPILVMGMMKAGTTSIYSYFKCGMDLNVTKLSHYECQPGGYLACGRKIQANVGDGLPAFHSIDHFHLYGELDANTGKGVILPQYKYLQEMYEAFPNATWILNVRDEVKWLSSIDRWQNLRQRFIWGDYQPDLPRPGKNKNLTKPTGEKDEDMIHFYLAQAQRVRDFVASHNSLHLVEVKIDAPDAGQTMQNAFGISSQCWGNKNVNKGDAQWSESRRR